MFTLPHDCPSAVYAGSYSITQIRRKGQLDDPVGNMIYIVVDANDVVVYVGRTRIGIKTRIQHHLVQRSPLGVAIRTAPLTNTIDRWVVHLFAPPLRFYEQLEQALIQHYRPKYNGKNW